MILADTSVWVEHLQNDRELLQGLVAVGEVLMHPLVFGELSCGRLPDRAQTLAQLGRLPRCPAISDEEVLLFLERHRLAGRGLSYIDVHVLATVATADIPLWTFDQKLRDQAFKLDLAADAFLNHLHIGTRPQAAPGGVAHPV